jgi:sugar lactone lactonase YvrE
MKYPSLRRLFAPVFVGVVLSSVLSPAKAQQVGDILTLAGGAVPSQPPVSEEGIDATQATLNFPQGLAVDKFHNVYVADRGRNAVRRVSWQGTFITTVAGTGEAGYSGDGGPAAQAKLNQPEGLATDPEGNLYIADAGNNAVRKVTADGTITTVAGSGVFAPSLPLDVGDGGPATQAVVSQPYGLAVDDRGNLFISSPTMNRIRKVTSSGIITTVAGSGDEAGSSDPPLFSGDGGPAVNARLDAPKGIALDARGNLFIADSRNFRARRVDAKTGIITTVAGNGEAGFSGDGGPATEARFDRVEGLAVDSDGNLFIADSGNHRVRGVDATTGIVQTVAGNGTAHTSGDGGPAAQAGAPFPTGVAVDSFGNVLVSTNGAAEFVPSNVPTYSDNRVRSVLAIAGPGLAVGGSFLRGDVNGDDVADVQDALLVLRDILGITVPEIDRSLADVNGDRRLGLADVRMLLQIALGLAA